MRLSAIRRDQSPNKLYYFEDGEQHDVCEAAIAILDTVTKELQSLYAKIEVKNPQIASLRDLEAVCRMGPCIGEKTE
jgi:hypothetical protein